MPKQIINYWERHSSEREMASLDGVFGFKVDDIYVYCLDENGENIFRGIIDIEEQNIPAGISNQELEDQLNEWLQNDQDIDLLNWEGN